MRRRPLPNIPGMTIAAHIESSAHTSSYLAQFIIALAEQQPNQQFMVFASKQSSHGFRFPSNCKLITIKPAIRNSLLLHYWYQFKLPLLLLDCNAAVFISENNVCSLRTNVTQLLLIQQVPRQPHNYPVKSGNQMYFKRFFSKFAAKATVICATNHQVGAELERQYPMLKGKIKTTLHGLDIGYMPATGEVKDKVLDDYTGGHEYFLYDCTVFSEQNLLSVLKAFSIFKKRLKSGMRLVVLNSLPGIPIKDFKNYKYRDEVLFVSNFTKAEEQRIMGAAYAAVYLPSFFETGNFGLHCLKAAVPLICNKRHGNEDTFQTAALYVTNEEKEIAECMMTLYKDEGLRQALVNAGTTLVSEYSWAESSTKLWQTISNYIPV